MEIKLDSEKREEIIDLTDKIKEIVLKQGKTGKACLIYVPHATCSIIVNENYDSAVCLDILSYLKKQIPPGIWEHDKIDNNADSHIKSALLGPGQVIPIEKGELQLGTWQGIALAEFDGPKTRRIIIKIL